jgi:hypothetical protein
MDMHDAHKKEAADRSKVCAGLVDLLALMKSEDGWVFCLKDIYTAVYNTKDARGRSHRVVYLIIKYDEKDYSHSSATTWTSRAVYVDELYEGCHGGYIDRMPVTKAMLEAVAVGAETWAAWAVVNATKSTAKKAVDMANKTREAVEMVEEEAKEVDRAAEEVAREAEEVAREAEEVAREAREEEVAREAREEEVAREAEEVAREAEEVAREAREEEVAREAEEVAREAVTRAARFNKMKKSAMEAKRAEGQSKKAVLITEVMSARAETQVGIASEAHATSYKKYAGTHTANAAAHEVLVETHKAAAAAREAFVGTRKANAAAHEVFVASCGKLKAANATKDKRGHEMAVATAKLQEDTKGAKAAKAAADAAFREVCPSELWCTGRGMVGTPPSPPSKRARHMATMGLVKAAQRQAQAAQRQRKADEEAAARALANFI